jgi:hypothetical protein
MAMDGGGMAKDGGGMAKMMNVFILLANFHDQ